MSDIASQYWHFYTGKTNTHTHKLKKKTEKKIDIVPFLEKSLSIGKLSAHEGSWKFPKF